VSPAFTRVLDASALLAFLHGEPGGDTIQPLLSGAAISAVNWSEVLQRLSARDVETAGLLEDLVALRLEIVSFDADQAETTAGLWTSAHRKGLSLGDRACLALALSAGVPAITADRAWRGLRVDVKIQVIR